MLNTLFSKHLVIPLSLAVLVTILPAEATRKHSIRPPIVASPQVVAEDQAAATRGRPDSAEPIAMAEKSAASREKEKESPAVRRGLLEILFGPAHRAYAAREVGAVAMDERMIDAVHLAERSARSRSIHRCWRFVKRALQKAGVVECYPQTALAKQAAVELPGRYGFQEIDVADPFDAPVGAVLVYGGRGAGHVELRTETGFVSDHASHKPSPRPLIGVFVKLLEG